MNKALQMALRGGAVTGLVRNVGQLVLMRGAVGVGEASYMSNAPGLIAALKPRFARWWLPDEIYFMPEIPKTSVGKYDKKALRRIFSDLPSSQSDRESRR